MGRRFDELVRLAAGDVRARPRQLGTLSGLRVRLRAHLKETAMILFTAAIAAVVIVYLFTALVRPEWF
jgi:hypothetical protein